MPRLLLGVSGGIAAYKALELVRLATDAGPRRARDPDAVRAALRRRRVVRRAERRAGAVAATFERDPLRGASRATRCPTTTPPATSRSPRAADVFLIAPASANTIAKLAHGLADNLLDRDRARRALPADRRAGDERPHVGARRRRRPTSRCCASAGVEVLEPGSGRLATHGEWGAGRLPEPAALLAAVEAALAPARVGGTAHAGHRRRHARADRRRALRRQPLVRADGLRARRRRRRRAARRSSSSPRTSRCRARAGHPLRRRRRRAAELAAGVRARVRGRRRARDVRGGRRLPARDASRAGKIVKRGEPLTLELEPTEDVLAGARRRAGATARRWSASPPSTATARSSARARSSCASASTRSSATTCRSPASASTPSATRSRSSRADARASTSRRPRKRVDRRGRARRRRGLRAVTGEVLPPGAILVSAPGRAGGCASQVGARPLFFRHDDQLQTDIESASRRRRAGGRGAARRARRRRPADLHRPPGGRVRSRSASASRTRSATCASSYALEVSSPGPRRPLTKPEHFQRFIGRRARVRTAPDAGLGERARVTGELVGATAQEVTLAAPEGVVAIPYAAIQRSHLVEE